MSKKSKTVSGTKEWAVDNVNIQNGCPHDCHYCYAKSMAIRFKRSTPDGWATPVLRPAAIDKCYKKSKGRVMFPTAHDITPENIDSCLFVLKKILAAGNEVLIVSKPHPVCIHRLCIELAGFKSKILFRFSIGSKSSVVLHKWEPGAPTFGDRKRALQYAHAAGFATSVSCEPMLDSNIDDVIASLRAYVTDSIWLGKANRLRSIVPTNSPNDVIIRKEAEKLIAIQSDEAINALYTRFKSDPMIKWKDSIKEVVGLCRPTEIGLDL
jgi:DNA repair photolyase